MAAYFGDDVAARLVAQGVGALAVNIFIGSAAKIPTTQSYPLGDKTKGLGPYVQVTETGGVPPTRTQDSGGPARTRRPTAQVLVSGADAAATRAMAEQAFLALDGIFNAVVNARWYLRIAARQEPTDMGFDATGNKSQFVFNVEAEGLP